MPVLQALTSDRKHLTEARDLLESMEPRFGVKPNGTAYNFVIHAAADAGLPAVAIELYHRLKEVRAALGDRRGGLWGGRLRALCG